MNIAKVICITGAVAAVIIGYIGKCTPHLFLSLPFPLSMVLWISTGNEMPPFVMKDAWKEDEIDTWTRDGDVIVSVGSKCGTNFMLYCTHQIRTKGTDTNDELFPEVNLATPWMDLRQSRAGNWAEQKDRYNTTILKDGRILKDVWDNPSLKFRIFKSHYAPPVLPVRKKNGKKLKYIAMVRNGLDMAASLTEFTSANTDVFRKLWGGLPPKLSSSFASEEGFLSPIKSLLPGGLLEDVYFGYVNGWWPYRNDPNVLLLHYSNVRKDLKGYVAKIASFLDVDLNESELSTVTERCSIEHMKKLDDKFVYMMPLNKDKGLYDPFNDTNLKKGKIVRKGKLGAGVERFSEKTIAKWKKAEEEQFGHDPSLLKWAREGGPFFSSSEVR